MVIALGESALDDPSSEPEVGAALVALLQPMVSSGVEVLVTHGGATSADGEPTSKALLRSLLGLGAGHPVTSLEVSVSVDPAALVFRRPHRPTGPVLSEARAKEARARGQTVGVEGRGYRRLVPQLEPQVVLDVRALRAALGAGVVVASGGVPVIPEREGWCRADAVLDHDLTAAVLADALDADQLFIVTGVSNVFEDYGTPHEEPIGLISVDELRNLLAEGHFPPGTMAPKVEACVRFVSGPGRRAVICDTASLDRAMMGLAGTRVIWTPSVSIVSEHAHHVV